MSSATEALRDRYVAGDLSREEYVERLALHHTGPVRAVAAVPTPSFATAVDADGTISLHLAKEDEPLTRRAVADAAKVRDALAELRDLVECECAEDRGHRRRCLSGYGVDVETLAGALGLAR